MAKEHVPRNDAIDHVRVSGSDRRQMRRCLAGCPTARPWLSCRQSESRATAMQCRARKPSHCRRALGRARRPTRHVGAPAWRVGAPAFANASTTDFAATSVGGSRKTPADQRSSRAGNEILHALRRRTRRIQNPLMDQAAVPQRILKSPASEPAKRAGNAGWPTKSDRGRRRIRESSVV